MRIYFLSQFVYNCLILSFVLFSHHSNGQRGGTDDDYNDSGEIDGEAPFTFSPFTFPPVTAGGLSYNLPGNLGSGRDCFKSFPHLKRRFSPEQLEFFCQQKRFYDDIIDKNGTSFQPYTTQQLRWIDSLRLTTNETKDTVNKVIRKEVRQLTSKEWRRFANAIRYMKGRQIDGVSHYDLLVMLSHPAMAPGAQVGAAFLPWHREYLRLFESALRKYHPANAIPYWDSTLDYPIPDPTGSLIWTPLMFGNNVGIVFKGPFRMFLFRSDNESAGYPLRRDAAVNGSLYSPSLINFFNSKTNYRDLTAYIDLTVEQANRKLHEWVGGSMNSIYYALQDPIALTNFAFLDYLWEEFRQNRQTRSNRTTDYPVNYEAGTAFHYGDSEMKPFGPLRNRDGLQNFYTDIWYEYEPRPTCTRSFPNSCKSIYLFCDRMNNRCVAKVRLGASCSGFGSAACFRGSCWNDVCTLDAPPAQEIFRGGRTINESAEMQQHSKGSSPGPPHGTLSPVPGIPWYSTPKPSTKDNSENAAGGSKSVVIAPSTKDVAEPGGSDDTKLPSKSTTNTNKFADAYVLETPRPKGPRPTKRPKYAGTTPMTTQITNTPSPPLEPELPTVDQTGSPGEPEYLPDGRVKQTPDEDANAAAGRNPVDGTKTEDRQKPGSPPEGKTGKYFTTTTLFPPSKSPAGDSGELLPDGRVKQKSEEDVGGGFNVVLPHEEGKPPLWYTPPPADVDSDATPGTGSGDSNGSPGAEVVDNNDTPGTGGSVDSNGSPGAEFVDNNGTPGTGSVDNNGSPGAEFVDNSATSGTGQSLGKPDSENLVVPGKPDVTQLPADGKVEANEASIEKSGIREDIEWDTEIPDLFTAKPTPSFLLRGRQISKSD